jgi:hypothetical protein
LNDGIFPQLNFKAVSVLDRYKWNTDYLYCLIF